MREKNIQMIVTVGLNRRSSRSRSANQKLNNDRGEAAAAAAADDATALAAHLIESHHIGLVSCVLRVAGVLHVGQPRTLRLVLLLVSHVLPIP